MSKKRQLHELLNLSISLRDMSEAELSMLAAAVHEREVTPVHKPDKRIAVIGGDSRVLAAPWPPWYHVTHLSSTDTKRLDSMIASDKLDLIILLTRWAEPGISKIARRKANCPVYPHPRGVGELVTEMPKIIERYFPDEKEKPVEEPPVEMLEVTPRPKRKTWLQQPIVPAVPEPPAPVAVPDPVPVPVPPPVAEPPIATFDWVPIIDALFTGAKVTSWSREELESLCLAYDESGVDADKLIATYRKLGGTRTNTSVWFMIQKVAAMASRPLDKKFEQQMRKLTKDDRKKREVFVVEHRESKNDQIRQEAVNMAQTTPAPAKTAPAASLLKGDDLFKKLIEYEILGVELGLKSKEDAYDNIVKLVRK